MPNIILVTGGTGLVGKAIEHVINTEPEGSRFGKQPGETWVFPGSSEGDLRCVRNPLEPRLMSILSTAETLRRPVSYSKSINLPMSSTWLP